MPSMLNAPLAAALLAFAAATLHAGPAPVRDTAETMHGVTVHDPYRYFENAKDPEVLRWMREQGAQARATLDAIPGREAMGKRVAQLSEAVGDSYTAMVRLPGDRLYYLKRARGERQAKLVLRHAGREQVLVDPEVQARRTGVPHAIDYFRPSWDGAYVAYGMSAGGSEDASLFIHDVAKGTAVGQPIPRVREANVSWLPDSRSFTYNQLRALDPETPDTEAFQDSSVVWQRVGAPASEARAVFGPTVNRQLGLVRLDVGSIVFTPGSRWMVVRTTDTTAPEGSLFVAQVADLGRGGEVPWKRIASPADAIVEIDLKGDDLYYRTHKDAPLFKLMKLDLRQPQLARAVEVARPPADGVLEGFAVGRNAVMASVREGTAMALRLHAPGDTAGKVIPLPFHGAANLHEDPAHAHDDWLYTLVGWTEPAREFRLVGTRSTDTGLRKALRPAGVPEIVVTDVQVRSHDGVEVPMTIVHRKGLARDGSNPTLLYGYGSYGLSFTANYRPTSLAWLERGGVLAFANVRGSGVHGEPWHRAGFKQTKRNTWKDGIACAQWLIAQRYASPATMAAIGGSAGGIFVGRAVTEAPQLFAAAISEVGVMDAVRAEESANGVTNISEFGSYKDPKDFPALLEMSTYHQVRDGTAYPAIMLVHGMNDSRVDVWQSAKAAARLQAATSSGKPILLRLDEQAGHGMGSTRTQRDSLSADIYSFLLWQMGKTAPR
jgi:prolyl oligopeptidase